MGIDCDARLVYGFDLDVSDVLKWLPLSGAKSCGTTQCLCGNTCWKLANWPGANVRFYSFDTYYDGPRRHYDVTIGFVLEASDHSSLADIYAVPDDEITNL